jgi:hypothetical protein
MKNIRLRTQVKAQNSSTVGKEDLINILSHVINNYQLGSSRVILNSGEVDGDRIIKLTNHSRIANRQKFTKEMKE